MEAEGKTTQKARETFKILLKLGKLLKNQLLGRRTPSSIQLARAVRLVMPRRHFCAKFFGSQGADSTPPLRMLAVRHFPVLMLAS
jgi:hypothetical protein